MNESDRGISRRQAIVGAAAAATAGTGAFVLLRDPAGAEPANDATISAAVAETTATAPHCVLAPEQTEGPYYIDNNLIRSNIRQGKVGAALLLKLQVLNASTCKPIRGATVEIWHCDAIGDYSGFNAAGTWLRGGQRSNANGNVTFKTIYPGWYQGRTTHIHVKVHVRGEVVHTGQLYFSEAVSAAVYENRAPYSRRGQKDTSNANDMIYRDGGSKSVLKVSRSGSGYIGRLAMGVSV